MNNLYEELENELRETSLYVSEDRILKNKVIEDALLLKEDLLSLLLRNDKLKIAFFKDQNGYFVFDKIKFQYFVSNKNFLPDSFTRFKNKIGLVDSNDSYIKARRDVVLAWPFKDCVLEGGQEDLEEKRDEVYWNSLLAPDDIDRLLSPKVFTDFKRYLPGEKPSALKKEDVDFGKENLLFKGNNLLVLSSIKQKFAGKVKLIYIDPPYNTGGDSFKYNDKFNHSTWLTFMKNRLELSRQFLSEDGSIFVQCDDNEAAYLKVLLDEVYGSDNFVTSFYIQVRYTNKTLNEDNDFQKVIETGFLYAKNINVFKPNKDKLPYKLDKFQWEITELTKGETIELGGKKVGIFKNGEYEIKKVEPSEKALKEVWATGSLVRQSGTAGEFLVKHLVPRRDKDGLCCLYKIYGMGEDGLGYRYVTGPRKVTATKGKYYSGVPLSKLEEMKQGDASKEVPINNFLEMSADYGNCRHEGGVDIGGGKKPEKMLEFVIKHFSNEGDRIMDFHLGSGTTACVSMKMKRKFIGVEQLDYGKNDSLVRLQNVLDGDSTGISASYNWKGGDSFVHLALFSKNEKYIKQVMEAEKTNEFDELFRLILENENLSYRIELQKLKRAEQDFCSLDNENKRKVLLSLLDMNHLYLSFFDISDSSYKVSEEDKKLNSIFYKDLT